MWRRFARRLFVFLLSVALAAGVMTRVVQADTADTTMAAMTANMPMHGKCDGCAGSEKATMSMACGVYCSGMVALTSPSVSLDLVVAGVVAAPAEPAVTGHVFPPDPYPPRSTSMN